MIDFGWFKISEFLLCSLHPLFYLVTFGPNYQGFFYRFFFFLFCVSDILKSRARENQGHSESYKKA